MDIFSHAHDSYFGNLIGAGADIEPEQVTTHPYVSEWHPCADQPVASDQTSRRTSDSNMLIQWIRDMWHF